MSWAERVEAITGSAVVASRHLAGGDLGGATCLELADGRVIVAKQGSGVAAEGAMLAAIGATGAPVPRLLACEDDLLLMDYVEADPAAAIAWDDLGQVLERLHRPSGEAFGWSCDHRFGPVKIVNAREANWVRFWGEHRLMVHAPHVGASLAARLEVLAERLGDRLPKTPPAALLHGDLWRGNILVRRGNVAALIDPAAYFGHREVDVAMLTVFDHPPQGFFDALELEAGWRERLPVYRLWPLLVHLRLFGTAYRPAVERALRSCGV